MRTNNRWVIAITGVFFQIALGGGLGLERFPCAASEAIRMEHFGDNADVYDQHFCPGVRRVLRWPAAQPQGTADRRIERGRALWAWSFSCQLLT
jgi:hypothetical protein